MQTLSRMQRSGDDVQALKRLVLYAALLLLYEPLSGLFFFLPPLLGVGAWRFFATKRVGERIFWVVYLYLFEVDRGLPFLLPIVTLALHFLLMRKLERFIACRSCLIGIGVILYYLLFTIVFFLYQELFELGLLFDPWLLLRYLILDLVVVYAI